MCIWSYWSFQLVYDVLAVSYMNVLAWACVLAIVLYTWCMASFTICCPPASPVVCEAPTPANGVTVLQPHSNVVNSEIVYQCEELGFSPSSNSSLCGEDGRWSPDPSEVICRMMNTTPGSKWVKCTYSSVLWSDWSMSAVCWLTRESTWEVGNAEWWNNF